MLQKNIDKEKRKERKLWTGFFTRRTPTKREKAEKNRRKYKEKDSSSPDFYLDVTRLKSVLDKVNKL